MCDHGAASNKGVAASGSEKIGELSLFLPDEASTLVGAKSGCSFGKIANDGTLPPESVM